MSKHRFLPLVRIALVLSFLASILLPSGFASAIGTSTSDSVAPVDNTASGPLVATAGQSKKTRNVCAQQAGNGQVSCSSRVVVKDDGVTPETAVLPAGYGPSQFLTGYGLSGQAPGRPIIAIVDAYDDPQIQADLATYSSAYGIAVLPACSGPVNLSAVSCFSKVDQTGGTNFPSTVNPGWALETSLDVEIAHSVCQNCSILLVEANSNSFIDLLAAVDRARILGATAVSNSWASGEFPSETSFDGHFNYPGIAFVFASGDSGFGTAYPAASPYVTAVGGTTLLLSSANAYQSEVVWSGTGSGCSLYESKQSWQTDRGCAKRTIADVAADADPSTGAAVYDSVPYSGQTGWFQVGGTSLSTPIIAAIYAMGGINSTVMATRLPYLNGNSNNLHDITSGSNGHCGGRSKYLCTATSNYDGPTGIGTPKGAGAF